MFVLLRTTVYTLLYITMNSCTNQTLDVDMGDPTIEYQIESEEEEEELEESNHETSGI